MPTESKIVVIGGGAIGLSVAYHLGKLGLDNVVLVEREQLTSGTSWHAAGIVGPLRSSKNLTEMAQYGIQLFHHLEEETGLSTGYQRTGGLWLAQTAERLIELKRIAAMGTMHYLHTEILFPNQLCKKFDKLNSEGLEGALWVEEDGQINPVDLCMAYAKGARQRGVEIRENACVAHLGQSGNAVTEVHLDDGSCIPAEAVVNCAGLWAREVAAMAGVDLPLRAVEHIYIVSDVVEGLPNPCPILRDLDSAIYFKGDAGRLVLGTFESNPKIWRSAGTAHDPAFMEFPEDWDHIEPMMHAGMHRVPVLADSGVTRVLNGPESFTPDTRQIMGRAAGLENFYVAAGFNSIGIMSSAGVGKVMAEWVQQAHPSMDLWEVDVLRFGPDDNNDDFLDIRIPESVHNQFAMHWPFKQYETGRERKQSVWHSSLEEQGAVFGAPTGWERPLWFAQDVREQENAYSYGRQSWWPCAEREAKCLMTHGAVFELSPFTKHLISGPNVVSALQRLCSRQIGIDIGRIAYTLMLNHHGGVELECTITRIDPEQFLIVSSAATRYKDHDWLQRYLPEEVDIFDCTDHYSILGVMGPRSNELLASLGAEELQLDQFPVYSSRKIQIANHFVRASRISYVGEKGWELMIENAVACEILSAMINRMPEFKIEFAGHWCLDSCRLEKNFAHWGHDMGWADTPRSVGLGFALDQSGTLGFIGEGAVIEAMQRKPEHQRVLFEVHGDRPLLLHDEPVYREDKLVGRTTSGGLGFRTGKALSMAMIQNCSELYTAHYEIDVAGNRYPATPLEQPPYDPKGDRLRLD